MDWITLLGCLCVTDVGDDVVCDDDDDDDTMDLDDNARSKYASTER